MKKILFLLLILISGNLAAQKDTVVIDQIIARVGDEIILQSDLESAYIQWLATGNSASRDAKCKVFEDLLVRSLLLNQAKLDSITVSEDELQMQAEARIETYLQQLGGIEELENYLNKTIFDIRKDLQKNLGDQLIAQKERNLILEDVSITPSEVAEYYKSLPGKSLPLVDITYEIRQIQFYPKLTKAEEKVSIDKIKEIREKIVSGKSHFAAQARLYSDDVMSAKKGGELGFMSRGELDPDFAAVAFSLDTGEVSEVVETQFGYHIIELLQRRGERINLRHILIKPYISVEAKQKTIKFADSIRNLALSDTISFAELAEIHSEDEKTKNSGGLLYNPLTEDTKFKIDDLPRNIKYDVIDLSEGEISKPIVTVDDLGNTVIKIYKIENKVPAHTANLKLDYKLIYDMALENKKEKILGDWIREQIENIYISINKKYKDCNFKYKNWFK